MTRLTEKNLWESHYRLLKNEAEGKFQPVGIKLAAKRILGKSILRYTSSFEDHILWNVIFRRYIPTMPAGKALEVGSAPGRTLIKLHQVFGFIPYGVEYSESAVELNRTLFAENGIDPGNVIFADFFDSDFQDKYKNYFDLVISNGFIEHFTEVESVIEKHLNLLAEGGYLIINVPNMMGLSFILVRLFNKERLAMHNIDIMRIERFRRLFPENLLTPLFLGYSGTFNLTLPPSINYGLSRSSAAGRFLHATLMSFVNLVLHLLFKNHGPESRFFSPNLTFIGIKKIRIR